MEVNLQSLLTEFARLYRSDQALSKMSSRSTLETQEIRSNAREARAMLGGVMGAMSNANMSTNISDLAGHK